MKLPLKIIGIFLIFALLTSCVAAATENKDLPEKEEISDFIAGIPVSDNYINTVFDAVIDKQPTWNCDIWNDKKTGNHILSLYYVDPDSANGYDSIYFDELGKEISKRGLEVDPKPVKSYVGENVSTENTDEHVQTADETSQTTDETSQTTNETSQTTDEHVQTADETSQTTNERDQTADEKDQAAEYEEKLDEYEKKLDKYEKRLDEYKEDQSVDYRSKSDKSVYTSNEGESQSVEDVAQTVKEVAHTVENVSQTVENVATEVEEKEETKRAEKIRYDIFIAVVGTVVGGFVLYKFGWNK